MYNIDNDCSLNFDKTTAAPEWPVLEFKCGFTNSGK